MRTLVRLLITFALLTNSQAAQFAAAIYATTGDNKPLGKVNFEDTAYGLLVTPSLQDLPPGLHGFHLHQYANCAEQGMKAGGHYDPGLTKHHKGPYAEGHLGDLPILYVTPDGRANTPILAPRLQSKALKGLAIIVHEGGDNYSDIPPMGGGGARIACGTVIEDLARN